MNLLTTAGMGETWDRDTHYSRINFSFGKQSRTTAMQSCWVFFNRGLVNLFNYWAYRCPAFNSSTGTGRLHKININLERNQDMEHLCQISCLLVDIVYLFAIEPH